MNFIVLSWFMMTSSNGNIFRVTGPLCGEFTGPGEFPTQRPVTRSFDVYFDLRLNKRLCKQSWGWWFETLLCPLWRHSNVSSCSASCSWRLLHRRIRHSHLTSRQFHSLVLWWRPPRIWPQRTRLRQSENSAMGTGPIYKNYYASLVRKMAWYKILIHVLIL